MFDHKTMTHPYLTMLYLGLICWIPIPFGSNRAWAWSLMEIWIFVIAISIMILSFQRNIPLLTGLLLKNAKPLLLLFVGFLVWTAVQLIPLPISWLEFVPPYAASIATVSGNTFSTISIDPDTTAKSLLKSLALVTFLFLMFILIDSHMKIRWLAYTILVSGLFQATYGSYMVLSGVEYTFFLEKEAYLGMATGTFINRNHLAGYLEMVLAIGIGLLISNLSDNQSLGWRERIRHLINTILSPKAFIRLTLIMICIGLILTKSRMGNTAFFISILTTGIIFLITARHATRSTSIFLSSIIVLDILLIGSWVGIDKVVQRIESTSFIEEHRDEVIRDTLTMIKDQPLTGIGSGNYFTAFSNYRQQDIWDNYYHAHNDYLEFSSESGLIGFLLLATAVLYSLLAAFQAMSKRHSPLLLGMAFACMMGILSILIHSSVDFNLQIPANAAMFILLMGLAIITASAPHPYINR